MYELIKNYAYDSTHLKGCDFVEYVKLEYHPAVIEYLQTPAPTDADSQSPKTSEQYKLSILPIFQNRWITRPTLIAPLTTKELTDLL